MRDHWIYGLTFTALAIVGLAGVISIVLGWTTAATLPDWIMAVATVTLVAYSYVTIEEGKKNRRKDTIEKMLEDVFFPLYQVLWRAKYEGTSGRVQMRGGRDGYYAIRDKEIENIQDILERFGHYVDAAKLKEFNEVLDHPQDRRTCGGPLEPSFLYSGYANAQMDPFFNHVKRQSEQLKKQLRDLAGVPLNSSSDAPHATRAKSSESSAEEREVIHHVDTAFAILLTIMVFQSNVIIGFLQTPASPKGTVLAIELVFLLVFTILAWLVGILSEMWWMRLCAWQLGLTVLLWELASLFVGMGEIQTGTIMRLWQSGYPLAILWLLSSVLTRFLVFHAYERRLLSVASEGIQIGILRLWKNVPLWIGLITFFLMLVMAAFYPT
jgi:hypothetical protein